MTNQTPSLFRNALPLVLVFWLSLIVTPLDCFSRRELGPRFYSWVRILTGFAFTFLVLEIATSVGILQRNQGFGPTMQPLDVSLAPVTVALTTVYLLLFVAVSLLHRAYILHRNLKQVRWHTYSNGFSNIGLILPLQVAPDAHPLLRVLYYFLREDDWGVYRFTEPLLWASLALILRLLSPLFGNYLFLLALLYFLRNNLQYFIQRNMTWDMLDAELEGEALTREQAALTKRAAHGFSIVRESPQLQRSNSAAVAQPVVTEPHYDPDELDQRIIREVMGVQPQNPPQLDQSALNPALRTLVECVAHAGPAALTREQRRLMQDMTPVQKRQAQKLLEHIRSNGDV